MLASRHDVKFLIVGEGYMKSDLERRVQELGISNAVRFLGSMSGQSCPAVSSVSPHDHAI